jgi:hypothetical protein
MSSTNRENSTNPEHNLTPAEIDDLNRLEGMAQQRLGSYLQVGHALTEIRDRQLYRDSHPSFETYVRERWGLSGANDDALSHTIIDADARATPPAEGEQRTALRHKPCEALAQACEQTLSTIDGDARVGIEIRLTVRRHGDPDAPVHGQSLEPSGVAEAIGDELLPTLRWLLTEATGTIGDVAHQLEIRATDVDDGAREQLRDDVLVLDGELAVVKALLLENIDWDSELGRLLKDDVPPFETDTDPEDDE